MLATKLLVPTARMELVARPRLTEKLLAGSRRAGAIILVLGPAGYGKTTLLS